ncbi:MAG: ATP-binding protein [Deltaproteobacteria bacterium]|nr:ATP-binding protein [Deltaproteobacteria bacterium]
MHYFNNFKNFQNAGLNLFAPLTILIGPNGSGKTNVIEAVELLSFLVHGRPLYEVHDVGGGAGGLEIRGGLNNCAKYGETAFYFGFKGSIDFEGKKESFHYMISIGVGPPEIIFESLTLGDRKPIFEAKFERRGISSEDIVVEYNNFAPGGRKPKTAVSANKSVISQYAMFAKKNQKFDACLRVINGIMNYLKASFVFDPAPRLMRRYERIGNNILSRDGANISAVLYSLKKGDESHRQSLKRILRWIKQIPEEPFDDFMFVEVEELGDVIFGLEDSKAGHRVDARMLSDGTLRSLAVLTALETVDRNSRVVIEEFDNGLHPSRVNVLLEAMSKCCERRDLNILVTTHNPATLNALRPDQFDGVVLCAWDANSNGFSLIRLCDLPKYNELFERGRLGDLVTRRVVEQYLDPKFEEKQKEKALEWLQNLP